MLSRENSLWALLERGWHQDPELRPKATDCLLVLDELSQKVLPIICDSPEAPENDAQHLISQDDIDGGRTAHHEDKTILDITDEVEMVSLLHEPHALGGFCDVSLCLQIY
jgi:hypothetical protein